MPRDYKELATNNVFIHTNSKFSAYMRIASAELSRNINTSTPLIPYTFTENEHAILKQCLSFLSS
jgi:hypothetical protein